MLFVVSLYGEDMGRRGEERRGKRRKRKGKGRECVGGRGGKGEEMTDREERK